MNSTASQLVPLSTAARWLQVPSKWLREEAEAGRVPCLRAGKVLLCDLAVVEAILLKRAGQGEGQADTATDPVPLNSQPTELRDPAK
jgi:hypothetical protein